MCKKCRFHTQIFTKSPSHTLPPLGHFAPLLWPPLTHPGCTTVTGIAKMHKGPWSPLIGVKEIFKRGNIMGLVHMPPHITTPLYCHLVWKKMPFSYTIFQKNLPTVGGGKPPPTPLPPLGHFAPLLWPPLTHPGCTTVTGIAKLHKGPWSPLIGVKEVLKGGICHLT